MVSSNFGFSCVCQRRRIHQICSHAFFLRCLLLILLLTICSSSVSNSKGDPPKTQVRIKLQLDDSPRDTKFQIRGPLPSRTLLAIREYGSYNEPRVQVTEMISLKSNAEYSFTLSDRSHDGITDGSFALFANREIPENLLLFDQANFTKEVTYTFHVPETEECRARPVPMAHIWSIFIGRNPNEIRRMLHPKRTYFTHKKEVKLLPRRPPSP